MRRLRKTAQQKMRVRQRHFKFGGGQSIRSRRDNNRLADILRRHDPRSKSPDRQDWICQFQQRRRIAKGESRRGCGRPTARRRDKRILEHQLFLSNEPNDSSRFDILEYRIRTRTGRCRRRRRSDVEHEKPRREHRRPFKEVALEIERRRRSLCKTVFARL